MFKILLKAILVVLLVFVIIGVIAKITLNTEDNVTTETTQATTVALYTLSTYDGRIALFKNGYSMPVEIYDVYIESLPQDEQQKIKDGITANSDEEALRLIEDYTS